MHADHACYLPCQIGLMYSTFCWPLISMPACAVAELKSGKKLEAGLVVVGVGAKPNTDMFKGQIDLLEDKPGGVKVPSTSYHPIHTASYSILCHVIFVQDFGCVHAGPMQAVSRGNSMCALPYYVSLLWVTSIRC